MAAHNKQWKLNLVIIGILITWAAFGQPATITPLWTSPTMHFLVDDLWSVQLSGKPSSDFYRMSVTVLKDGQQVLSLQSWSFRFEKGELALNAGLVRTWGPIEMTIHPSWQNIIERWGGQLPPGEYQVVYKIIRTDEQCLWTGPLILEASFRLIVLAQLQPMPVFPLMDDTLCAMLPVFSWTTSAPYPDVSYVVSIAPIARPEDAKMWTGQSALWQSDRLTGQQWSPVWFNPPLTTGWYAWTVTAYVGEESVGQSLPARFFFKEKCKETEDTDSALLTGRYDLIVLGLEKHFMPHQDTVRLRWRSSCDEKPTILKVLPRGKAEEITVIAHRIQPWWFVAFSIPAGKHSLHITQCGKSFNLELNLYKINER